MRRACALLTQPNIRVREVAFRLGYDDALYPKNRNGDEQEDAEATEYQSIAWIFEAYSSSPLERFAGHSSLIHSLLPLFPVPPPRPHDAYNTVDKLELSEIFQS